MSSLAVAELPAMVELRIESEPEAAEVMMPPPSASLPESAWTVLAEITLLWMDTVPWLEIPPPDVTAWFADIVLPVIVVVELGAVMIPPASDAEFWEMVQLTMEATRSFSIAPPRSAVL